MANEEQNAQDIDLQDLPAEGTEAEIDWQAEARKREGAAKRYKTQTQKLKEELAAERAKSSALAGKNDNSSPKEKSEFDYGELAFLTAKGVPDEDHEFLLQEVKSTGKPLKELLGYNYVKEQLKANSEARQTKEAMPSGSKRAGQAQVNTEEYWLAKIDAGKANIMDVPSDLRFKVHDLRRSRAKQRNIFTDNPVV